ncbi:MAG: hypothetical protein HQ592_00180, partial [Planctomycetes bacterium]|nr:hypothetical protein [Planctomycetota bacterium]
MQTEQLIERLRKLHNGIRSSIIRRRAEVPIERLIEVVGGADSDVKFD